MGQYRLALVIFTLVFARACAQLPHVDPRPRNLHQAAFATVQIDYSCTAADPFPAPLAADHGAGISHGPSTSFARHHETGTVISERHMLSALHAFDKPCPWIPTIIAWVGDRPLRMFIERRDRDPDGIVRLKIMSGSTFGLGIAPPQLGEGGPRYRLATIRGTFEGTPDDLRLLVGYGDGGSALYTLDGRLVGILLGTDDADQLKFARVDASWLEGT